MAIEINVAAVVGEAVEEGVVVVEAVVGIDVTAVVGFELLGMRLVHWLGLLLRFGGWSCKKCWHFHFGGWSGKKCWHFHFASL